jgi:indolepyruvate ferredoxin oxidoreductase
LKHAIKLNGAMIDQNLRAFEIGRWAALYPGEVEKILDSAVIQIKSSLKERIEFRSKHLEAFQNKSLSKKFIEMINSFKDQDIQEAVAINYHRVLAYKDEYEVARLHLGTYKKVSEKFENVKKIKFHLAPPIISKEGKDGRARKIEFGWYMIYIFKFISLFKWLRGSRFDLFSYSKDRRLDLQIIDQYEHDLRLIKHLDLKKDRELILELLNLPSSIKGFGIVKRKNFKTASIHRQNLLEKLNNPKVVANHAAE